MEDKELMKLNNNFLSFKDEFATAIMLNSKSHNACLAAGQQLLDEAKQNGMNDELDKHIADYIDKTRRTLRAMNDRRSPVTKTFDEMRALFTKMENEIDATKQSSIPYALQAERNRYAKQRYEAEERARREQQRLQIEEEKRRRFREDLQDAFVKLMNGHVTSLRHRLSQLVLDSTPLNYADTLAYLRSVPEELSRKWYAEIAATLEKQFQSNPATYDAKLFTEVRDSMFPTLSGIYHADIPPYAANLVNVLEQRKKDYEATVKTRGEEAALQQRKALEEETIRQLEEEREAAKEEERRKAEQKQREAEMQKSFDAVESAQPAKILSAAITKRIELTEPKGILPVLTLWWSREGCRLTVEELRRMFRRQLTFAEKMAREDIFIQDDAVRYVDEVKAK
jgi:hypothetical protein